MREHTPSLGGSTGGPLVAAVVTAMDRHNLPFRVGEKKRGLLARLNVSAAPGSAPLDAPPSSAPPASRPSKNRQPRLEERAGRREHDLGTTDSLDFEAAVDDFNLIAQDVQNFMLASSRKPRGVPANGLTREAAASQNARRRNAGEEASSSSVAFPVDSDSSGSNSSNTSSDVESSSDSDSAGERDINSLETITEEDRASSLQSNPGTGVELLSSPEDDSTVKGNDAVAWSEGSSGTSSNRESTSDLSSCCSDHPKSSKDSSTLCNSDFQWISKESTVTVPAVVPSKMLDEQPTPSSAKPPTGSVVSSSASSSGNAKPRSSRRSAPGSLDRRRNHHVNHQHSRQERDQKSRSTHVLKSPPKFDDYVPPPHPSPLHHQQHQQQHQYHQCQGWCCNSNLQTTDPFCFLDNFHRRHERSDPQRYGSNPVLMEHHRGGSHPDIYSDCGSGSGRYQQPYGCCSYHAAPPPCCYLDRGYHWSLPLGSNSYSHLNSTKGPDFDDKLRKLQTERDNLQLQVQVLNDQVEAQTDKINDLEKSLNERKQQLVNSEDLLQREMLSRSSLETQKLELMSAISEMKLHQAALEREILEVRSSRFNNNTSNNTSNALGLSKPPASGRSRNTNQPQQHSTPVHHGSNQALNSLRMSPSPSPLSTGTSIAPQTPRRADSFSSSQDIQTPKTPPATYRRHIDIHYGSLPRQQFISNGEILPAVDSNANPANGKKGVAFADTERTVIEDGTDGSPQSPSLSFNKNKGIKKIFGRIKRSGSGNLEDIPGLSEFQRGGVRATAAARLGWNENQLNPKPEKPFAEWDTENICDWLQDLGLEQYIMDAKRWIKNGQQLQETSIQEIEKELAIKNILHRKKLQLAIIDTMENSCSDHFLAKAGKLDTAWVLRWLDDSGLPQHKEAFLMNRIDGRVLHRMTIDDLAVLHVTSLLHVASLKRGIQVLRENDFDPCCLQRRSLPDDPERPTNKQICLWTTHRVMEWLRAVDLAEYAPNLRGAGVHGGLMVLEEKFTSELLASLLNIPQGKTLLRRHLNTHFKELLGKDIIQEKRESEATLGYIPLTPSAKLKVSKKSQFSLKRKKSKGEMDYGDLVCPLNPNSEGEMNGSYRGSVGAMRVEELREEAASQHSDDSSSSLVGSCNQSPCMSPLPDRHHQV